MIVTFNVTLLVAGQILWKIALNRHPLNSMEGFVSLMTQPAMIFGCLLFAVATLVWFYALGKYDLSRIYPLQSMAYVVGAISGLVIFKEQMSLFQWLGIMLIVGGAFLVART
jgi:uncharacterized membrane protein